MSSNVAKVETIHEVPTASESAAIIQVIERAAANPDVDVDKMERLLAMHERILGRNAEQAFNEAMKAAQEAMPQVVRDAENEQTRSKYTRLETLAKAMNPVITRYGFSMSFGTDNSHMGGHYRITCKVSHVGGHSRDYHADIPVDDVGMKGSRNKTATHAFGSSMSYGRRYLTLLIFNVTMKNDDDDGNGAGSGYITEEQKAYIIDALQETGADTVKFLSYMGAASVDQIPANAYMKAKTALEAKRRAM